MARTSSTARPSAKPRESLSKERVLAAAMALADRSGIDSLTMRRLGQELGVEAMSLYKHVANKDAILDGLVDLIVAEMAVSQPDHARSVDWREAMRLRAASTRAVLRNHPWAIGLFESRGSRGPAVVAYLEATIASLLAGGFPLAAAGHAFWLLDSFVYGHVIQELSMAPGSQAESGDSTEADHPHLAELAALANGQGEAAIFSFDIEFEFGLELIFSGLEAHRTAQR